MPAALDEIIAELSESDRQERIDLLIDFAEPPRSRAPGKTQGRFSPGRGMPSPVYLFAEMVGHRVALLRRCPDRGAHRAGIRLALDRGPERGNRRGGAQGARRLGQALHLQEVLGMLRVRGLGGVLRRIKGEVTRAAMARAENLSLPEQKHFSSKTSPRPK